MATKFYCENCKLEFWSPQAKYRSKCPKCHEMCSVVKEDDKEEPDTVKAPTEPTPKTTPKPPTKKAVDLDINGGKQKTRKQDKVKAEYPNKPCEGCGGKVDLIDEPEIINGQEYEFWCSSCESYLCND